MEVPIYQVDAFTNTVFSGNPAAVCPLDSWIEDAVMQAIAAENNLAETAFFVPAEADSVHDFDIRWFTPTAEVPLCGHATLASADIIFRRLGFAADTIHFRAQGGDLVARRHDDRIALDFPAWSSQAAPLSDVLDTALGRQPAEMHTGNYLMAVFESEAAIAGLAPDMARIAEIEAPGIIVTAPAEPKGNGGVDFVSRFFAPRLGVPEDPVTGSAHCQLVPYWAVRLGRDALTARQVSPRGGTLFCRLTPGPAGDRVEMAGHAVEYLRGTITV